MKDRSNIEIEQERRVKLLGAKPTPMEPAEYDVKKSEIANIMMLVCKINDMINVNNENTRKISE